MGKLYDDIEPEIAAWVKKQHMFFVATAPLANDGHVNCSPPPKGLDTLRILGPRRVVQRWAEKKGAEGLPVYRRQKNARSIDGLPAMDPGENDV